MARRSRLPRQERPAMPNVPKTPNATYVHMFDSWAEFIAFCSQKTKWTNSEAYDRPRDFNGNVTFAQALHMAELGWPEGRKNLSDALAIVNPHRDGVPVYGRDVAGAYPIVPLAVAGDPMSMHTYRRSMTTSHPVVTIDYNISVSGSVNARYITNRGAALLSIVDALESRGYSVELRIFAKTHCDGKRVSFCTVYKRAGDALDIDRAAFALTHPAVLRRFFFAVCEQHPDCERELRFGYGYPDRTPWEESEDTIFIDGANSGDYSVDSARQQMESKFERYMENA